MKKNFENCRTEVDLTADYAGQDLLLAELLMTESAAWEQLEDFAEQLSVEQKAILRHEITRRQNFYLQMLCKRAQLFGE